MNREAALTLMQEYVSNVGLRRHMLAVEAAMRAYASHYLEDVEKWGIVGLLHDFDYERWPDAPNHPLKGSEILREKGYPEDVIYAILSHANYLPDYPRIRPIEKVLFAVDELCGFLSSCSLVNPEGLNGVTVEGVKKKLKSKGFAAKVNRDDIHNGVKELGVELDTHIQFVIEALKPHAVDLGLVK